MKSDNMFHITDPVTGKKINYRPCPICGDLIKYKSFQMMEKAEKHSVCCKKCNIASRSYKGKLRDETNYDRKLTMGFVMSSLAQKEYLSREDVKFWEALDMLDRPFSHTEYLGALYRKQSKWARIKNY